MANTLECKSVAIPAISSGIYGFPKPLCAKTFFEAIDDFCIENNKSILEDIRLTNFDKETTDIFQTEFERIFEQESKLDKEETKEEENSPIKEKAIDKFDELKLDNIQENETQCTD